MSYRISVLLPTRKRPNGLRAAVTTLMDLASRPEQVEYVFATDTDDASVFEILKTNVGSIFAEGQAHEMRTERLGYHRMHDYYNELAARAKGELLFIWNDDTEMQTKGWDELLLAAIEPKRPLVQFMRRNSYDKADETFPVVDRRIFEAVGHLANHCYVDLWLGRVSAAAGVMHLRNDVVFHHHRWTDGVQDDNSRAVNGPEGHGKWFTMDAERAADAQKITELLKRLEGEQ